MGWLRRNRWLVVLALTLAWVGAAEGTASAQEPQFCNGLKATHVGGPGRNNLVGTNGDDVIVGLGGNDRIRGRGGNDVICAGPGNDNVDGGPGDDIIFGEQGRDVIRGSNGDDTVDGGIGNDNLRGDNGDDVLEGGGGVDRLSGGAGDDELSGGDANDRLWGNNGDDVLEGDGGANNRLDGGSGDDACDIGGGGSENRCEVQPGSIAGLVWADADRDGERDQEEDPVVGVAVRVVDVDGSLVRTTVTDDEGRYEFTELAAGSHRVTVDLPAGRATTTPDAPGVPDDLDSDVDQDGHVLIELAAGEHRSSVDGGLVYDLEIGGRLFRDLDGDGQRGTGEPRYGPSTIRLLDPAGQELAETTSDPSTGLYAFDGLDPGTYVVEFEVPEGLALTAADVGDDATDSDPDPTTGEVEVTIGDGAPTATIDAGFVSLLATIGDLVWVDLDEDGIQDPDEPGLPGVELSLRDRSTSPVTVVATTTTDDDGAYQFTDVASGQYDIHAFPLPAGYRATISNVGGDDTIDSDLGLISTGLFTVTGVDDPTIDLGLKPEPAIRGTVFVDENGNGVVDSREDHGTPRTRVELYDSGGTLVADDSVSGTFVLNNLGLEPDTYTLRAIPPPGYGFTIQDASDTEPDSDVDPVTGEVAVTVTDDAPAVAGVGIGLVALSNVIGDQVWLDRDRDGEYRFPDVVVPGVEVGLRDPDTSTVLDTTTTDEWGRYAFTDLAPGDYQLVFTRPFRRVWTEQNAPGVDEDDDSDVAVTGVTDIITVNDGDRILTVDAGLVYDLRVRGRTWADLDGDGDRNSIKEPDLRANVHLLDEDGQVLATTLSGSNGRFEFDGLDPGTYRLEFQPVDGYGFSPTGGTPGVDSAADPVTGRTTLFELSDGDGSADLEAGYVPEPGSIGDRVWVDRDLDGLQDPGEPGYEGLTVQLLDPTNLTVLATTATDAAGLYTFDDVAIGDYRLQFLRPNAHDWIGAGAGSDDTIDSDVAGDGTVDVTVGPGQDRTDIDAGLVEVFIFNGIVWDDLNGDGLSQSGDEPRVDGVLVELVRDDGQVVASTRTGQSGAGEGRYNLFTTTWGRYQVRFTPPEGFDFTTPNPHPALGSSVDASGLSSVNVVDGAGILGVRAGLVPQPGTIGDRVWLDANRNGLQDADEEGVGGVRVELLDVTGGGSVAAVATTDPDGSYRFDDVPTRTSYSVAFENPDDRRFAFTTRAAGDGRLDSDADAQGLAPELTLDPGQSTLDVDAGLVRRLLVTGQAWDDDGDGIREAAEAPVGGARVDLLDGDDNVVDTQTTRGDNGRYTLEAPSPGTYRVRLTPPTDRSLTASDVGGDDGVDSDFDPVTGTTDPIALDDADPLAADVDAGLLVDRQPERASIGDRVWLDENSDGIQDPGEPGIDGVVVRLLDERGGELATATTDPNGRFTFTDLEAGTYELEFPELTGRERTGAERGPDDVDSDANEETGRTGPITLADGEVDDTVDAGYVDAADGATIEGRVWSDADGDGIRDAGEQPIEGATVRLFFDIGTSVIEIDSTPTRTDGSYAFTDLPPDRYQILIEVGGATPTTEGAGSDETVDSDIRADGRSPSFEVGAGQVAVVDGGFVD